jgi:hypothetical protein
LYLIHAADNATLAVTTTLLIVKIPVTTASKIAVLHVWVCQLATDLGEQVDCTDAGDGG